MSDKERVDRLDEAGIEEILGLSDAEVQALVGEADVAASRQSLLGAKGMVGRLRLARAKADALGLGNIEFRPGDMLDLRLPPENFDAVVCVFGVFFVPDIGAAVSALWHHVRPGGKLAITTWGPRFLEPANTAFWDSIREVRPDLHKGFNPWDRICDPASLREVLRAGGVEKAEVVAESGAHAIASPEAWWAAILGSGYRGTVEQLSPTDRDQVHTANLDYIRSSGIASAETNVVFAVATKSDR